VRDVTPSYTGIRNMSGISKNIFLNKITQDLDLDFFRAAVGHPIFGKSFLESPFPLDELSISQVSDTLKLLELHKYPREIHFEVESLIRNWHNLPADASVLLGNGSFDILELVAQLIRYNNKSVLLRFNPDFYYYDLLCKKQRIKNYIFNYSEFGQLDLHKTLDKINKIRPNFILFSNPNNPLGTFVDLKDILEIARNITGIIFIDETYAHYSPINALDLLHSVDNVCVIRSFSKIGLQRK
jgi:histidinol-phosphate aminotransferase